MQVTLGGGSHKEPNLVGIPLVFYMAKFGRANGPMGSDTPAMYTWILCRVLYLAYILLSRYIVTSNVGIAGILFQNGNYLCTYIFSYGWTFFHFVKCSKFKSLFFLVMSILRKNQSKFQNTAFLLGQHSNLDLFLQADMQTRKK